MKRLHFDKTVSAKHSDDFIQLFRLKTHSTRKVIVLETKRKSQEKQILMVNTNRTSDFYTRGGANTAAIKGKT